MNESILSEQDFMLGALIQARRALGNTTPNPAVGAVLVDTQGRILGEGHTQPAGGPHAEVMAIRDAQAKGHDTSGSRLYVTLEPCSHFGRTPPCTDAVIAAGIRHVTVAMTDPNPRVAGSGLEKLRAQGITVDFGAYAEEAEALNIGFFKRMRTGLPWVRLKLAASLDGQAALQNGQSQWITSATARQDGHAWRSRACAILTGMGTVKADDPQLTVRLPGVKRQPQRIVVDNRLEIDPSAKLLQGPSCWIATCSADTAKEKRLRDVGAEIARLPGTHGKIDLPALIAELGRRNLNEIHVEAGPRLGGALLNSGCVDELLLYLAPSLLGPGRGLLELPIIETLQRRIALTFKDISTVGSDLRVIARVDPT